MALKTKIRDVWRMVPHLWRENVLKTGIKMVTGQQLFYKVKFILDKDNLIFVHYQPP